jgi:cytidylate kinase
MTITIDGYAGTGKSTAAAKLAEQLGFVHLNSGLYYRAYAFSAITMGVKWNAEPPEKEILRVLLKTKLSIAPNEIILNGEKINEKALRTSEIEFLGAQMATNTFVRDMVNMDLREVALKNNCVIEGRDTGTALFPDAQLKFFFTADIRTRAERLSTGKTSTESILNDLIFRDKMDEQRSIAPLVRPANAIDIDTTVLDQEEVVTLMLSHYEKRS